MFIEKWYLIIKYTIICIYFIEFTEIYRVVFIEIKQGISLKQILPPYFSYAVAEVSCVEKQSHENWKVEPKKSVPFSEKETNPEVKYPTYGISSWFWCN